MAKAKKTKVVHDTETAWTLRLPESLIEQLDALVHAMNARGQGKWSRKSLVISILQEQVEVRSRILETEGK